MLQMSFSCYNYLNKLFSYGNMILCKKDCVSTSAKYIVAETVTDLLHGVQTQIGIIRLSV